MSASSAPISHSLYKPLIIPGNAIRRETRLRKQRIHIGQLPGVDPADKPRRKIHHPQHQTLPEPALTPPVIKIRKKPTSPGLQHRRKQPDDPPRQLRGKIIEQKTRQYTIIPLLRHKLLHRQLYKRYNARPHRPLPRKPHHRPRRFHIGDPQPRRISHSNLLQYPARSPANDQHPAPRPHIP